MRDLLAAHMAVHFRFFRRNRLLLAVAVLFAVFFALSMTSTLVFLTSGGKFQTLTMVSSQLLGMVGFLVPGMGLLFVFSHLRDRSLKTIVTKPAPPEVWLLSGLLTSLVVAFVLDGAIVSLTLVLSLAWGLPIQGGFLFLGLDAFVTSAIVLSYLSFFAMLFHPIVALLLLSILNESAVHGLGMMLAVGENVRQGNPFLRALRWVVDGLYYVLPMFQPFADRSKDVESSLRTAASDWATLAMRSGYALAAVSLFFALTALSLRRKSLI